MSIKGMRMRLPELQDDDKKAKKLKSEGLPEVLEDIEQTLHYQGLLYPKSHLLKANKQALQQSLCRPFWYKEDSKANSQEVLLVNTTTRH